MLIIFLILKIPVAKNDHTTLRQRIDRLDPLGTACFLPGIVCLLLALQWGGSTYAWDDGRIIALLILFGVLIIAFIGIQIWKKENATVPPRIISQRSIAFGLCYQTCVGASMMTEVYWLPIWFQAIKGASPVHSGIMNLPLILSLVVGSMSTGFLISKVVGYCPCT